MEKERSRYSLIIVTKTGLMYCYNPSCDHFERIFNKSGEIKTTLPKIDQITCIFDNQEALAEYYGIEDEGQYSCVKYYQGGPVLLRPAYNNEKWIPVAHSCVGYKLDLDSNEYNRIVNSGGIVFAASVLIPFESIILNLIMRFVLCLVVPFIGIWICYRKTSEWTYCVDITKRIINKVVIKHG